MVGPVDGPSFLGRQDAAERIALPQSLARFGFVKQHFANDFPGLFQNFQPFANRRHGTVAEPALAGGPGPDQTDPGGISVNPGHDGPGHSQTALVYSLVRLHLSYPVLWIPHSG